MRRMGKKELRGRSVGERHPSLSDTEIYTGTDTGASITDTTAAVDMPATTPGTIQEVTEATPISTYAKDSATKRNRSKGTRIKAESSRRYIGYSLIGRLIGRQTP